MSGKMRCPRCGRSVSRERLYCPHCNTSLHSGYWPAGVQTENVTTVEERTYQPLPDKQQKARRNPLTFIVALFVVGAFLLGLVLFMNAPFFEQGHGNSFNVTFVISNEQDIPAEVDVLIMSDTGYYTRQAELSAWEMDKIGTYEFAFDSDVYGDVSGDHFTILISCEDLSTGNTYARTFDVEVGNEYEVIFYLADETWVVL